MSFINPCHRGLAYGDGYMQGDGALGQVVRLAGDDLFAVNTDPTVPSFGVLITDYAAGEMPGIYCMGGVYETDAFEGSIAAGDALKVSSNGKLVAGTINAGEYVLGRAISVVDGALKFLLHAAPYAQPPEEAAAEGGEG